MAIFTICGAIIVATLVSGVPGAIGVATAVIIANCYHAFD